MARFRDTNAPEGRVVFGGEAFRDGLTADINPGAETLKLFKSAGIHAEKEPAKQEPDAAVEAAPATKSKK